MGDDRLVILRLMPVDLVGLASRFLEHAQPRAVGDSTSVIRLMFSLDLRPVQVNFERLLVDRG